MGHGVWRSIVHVLKGPHFSVSKRLNVSSINQMPCIFDHGIPPVVPAFTFEFVPSRARDSSQKLNVWECSRCFSVSDTVLDQRADLLVCTHCGFTTVPSSTDQFIRSSRQLYRPRKYSDNFYKRESHFRSWLARLQGKERRRVPGAVVDQVLKCMKADNIKQTNYWVIRGILHRLKLTKYYANVNQIGNLIRGRPAFQLSPKHEKMLVVLFLSLREVYQQVSDQRVNMLHYPYVIRKLCEELGWTRMAAAIPLLKSPSRIQVLDTLWKRICEIKGWTFRATAPHSRLDTRNPYSTRI